MIEKRRVVVTGLGAVTPLGTGVEKSWQALCRGQSGIGKLTKFDASNFRTQIAAELKDFNAEDFLEKKRIRRTDPFIHYALVATEMALRDSGLIIDEANARRVGVVIGTCVGGMMTYERTLFTLQEDGADKLSPFFITGFIPNMAVAEVSIVFGAKGPGKCVVTACATGSTAIGDSFRLIQYGEADAMIAGGSDAYILPVGVGGLNRMGALSCRNDEPARASRPFDKDRDGFVLGEGAGTMILEELEHAKRRGARIYAEVIGYGSNVDGYHITDPECESQAECMRMSMRDAGIGPEQVDYINAHGTSTISNDRTETRAIKAAFGDEAQRVAISSNKSMMGHLLAAAGAVEAIFTLLTIRAGIIPPTINYETPDPECDLDYVPNVAREVKIKTAMSNSFGFGGANAVLVFRSLSG